MHADRAAAARTDLRPDRPGHAQTRRPATGGSRRPRAARRRDGEARDGVNPCWRPSTQPPPSAPTQLRSAIPRSRGLTAVRRRPDLADAPRRDTRPALGALLDAVRGAQRVPPPRGRSSAFWEASGQPDAANRLWTSRREAGLRRGSTVLGVTSSSESGDRPASNERPTAAEPRDATAETPPRRSEPESGAREAGRPERPQGMVPGRERRRLKVERGAMRVVATGGIIGIAVTWAPCWWARTSPAGSSAWRSA